MADKAPSVVRRSACIQGQTPGATQPLAAQEQGESSRMTRGTMNDESIASYNGSEASGSRPFTPERDPIDNVAAVTEDELRGGNLPRPSLRVRTTQDMICAQLARQEKATIITPGMTYVGGIIGKRPLEFEGKKRDHTVVHNWIMKHRRFHMLNPQILPEYRTLNSVQYLSDTAAI